MGILLNLFGTVRKARCKIYTTDGCSGIVKVDFNGFGDYSSELKNYIKEKVYVETGKIVREIEFLGFC